MVPPGRLSMVLVVGAAERALSRCQTLRAGSGPDGGVVVLDPSGDRLAELERSLPDARILYLIGDAEVVPLPSASMDAALGGSSPDVERV